MNTTRISSQLKEQGAQEVLVEQGHENELQQKTYHISSFPEDDELLVKKAEMKSYNEEDKELLMRVLKEINMIQREFHSI